MLLNFVNLFEMALILGMFPNVLYSKIYYIFD